MIDGSLDLDFAKLTGEISSEQTLRYSKGDLPVTDLSEFVRPTVVLLAQLRALSRIYSRLFRCKFSK